MVVYVMVYCLCTGHTELKQDNWLGILYRFPLLSLSAYSMGPSRGKEVLGEKYKEGTRKTLKDKYKYNYKSQFIIIVRVNYK